MTITDQIRKAILESGRSRYDIAKESGVTEAALSRFVHGQRGLTLASVDALAETLGLELAPKKQKKRRPKGEGISKRTK